MKRCNVSRVMSVMVATLVVASCGVATRSATSVDTPDTTIDSSLAVMPASYAQLLGPEFDGIYVDASSVVTPLANGVVEVDTGRPCESFRQGVLGGDASLFGDFTFPDISFMGQRIESSGFLVRLDSRLIYIETAPQTDVIGCIARLYSGLRSEVALPGSTSATPGFWSVTPTCMGDAETSWSITSFLLTADGYGGQLMLTLSGGGTTRSVSVDSAMAGDGPDGFLAMRADAMSAIYRDPSLMGEGELPPAALPEGATVGPLMVAQSGTATLTAADDSLAGTVQLGDFQFPFACAEVG